MDDLISRTAAMTMPVLPKEHRDYISFELDDIYEQGWNECQSFIAKLPSAEPERKRGEWIIRDNPGTGWYRVTCSECGEDFTSVIQVIGFFPDAKVIWDYCPNCGADMKGEQNE